LVAAHGMADAIVPRAPQDTPLRAPLLVRGGVWATPETALLSCLVLRTSSLPGTPSHEGLPRVSLIPPQRRLEDHGPVPTRAVTIALGGRMLGVQPDSQEWRFTQLWTAAHPTVAGFVRGMVPDRAAVDDILQEVAVALFAQFTTYDQTRPFVAWALGIAKHKVQDRWRTLARAKHVVQDTAVLEAMAEISAEMDDEFETRRAALQECLSHVQGRASDLLRLHYHEGLEPRHIAEQLGLEAGHVRVLLNRVRGVLRDCIERRIAAPTETSS